MRASSHSHHDMHLSAQTGQPPINIDINIDVNNDVESDISIISSFFAKYQYPLSTSYPHLASAVSIYTHKTSNEQAHLGFMGVNWTQQDYRSCMHTCMCVHALTCVHTLISRIVIRAKVSKCVAFWTVCTNYLQAQSCERMGIIVATLLFFDILSHDVGEQGPTDPPNRRFGVSV